MNNIDIHDLDFLPAVIVVIKFSLQKIAKVYGWCVHKAKFQ